MHCYSYFIQFTLLILKKKKKNLFFFFFFFFFVNGIIHTMVYIYYFFCYVYVYMSFAILNMTVVLSLIKVIKYICIKYVKNNVYLFVSNASPGK